jgi:hypothetical protein
MSSRSTGETITAKGAIRKTNRKGSGDGLTGLRSRAIASRSAFGGIVELFVTR